MKVDLEQELTKASAARTSEVERFSDLKEVKLLLEHSSQQEKRVLANFELDDSIKRIEKETGVLLEMEDFKSQYGNAFSLPTIKGLALDFRMKFLPLHMYQGAIDPLLANVMTKFGEEHGVDVTAHSSRELFYVLAPAEDFKLETKENVITVRKIVSLDPLLFYRGDTKSNNNRDGQLWTLVHKWGSEFTWWRWLRAIPYRNATNLWVANSLAYSAIAWLLVAICVATYGVSPLFLVGISALIGGMFSTIRSANLSETDAKNFFTEKNWSDGYYHVDKTVVETIYTR